MDLHTPQMGGRHGLTSEPLHPRTRARGLEGSIWHREIQVAHLCHTKTEAIQRVKPARLNIIRESTKKISTYDFNF